MCPSPTNTIAHGGHTDAKGCSNWRWRHADKMLTQQHNLASSLFRTLPTAFRYTHLYHRVRRNCALRTNSRRRQTHRGNFNACLIKRVPSDTMSQAPRCLWCRVRFLWSSGSVWPSATQGKCQLWTQIWNDFRDVFRIKLLFFFQIYDASIENNVKRPCLYVIHYDVHGILGHVILKACSTYFRLNYTQARDLDS